MTVLSTKPTFTDAGIEMLTARVRREALEEAARACEKFGAEQSDHYVCNECADVIRALKEK